MIEALKARLLPLFALAAAGALPLVLPLALAVPSFPPALADLGRDWTILTILALGSWALLSPACRGLTRAAAVVALASIVIAIWPAALLVGKAVGLPERLIDSGMLAGLAIGAFLIRRAGRPREVLAALALCCAVPSFLIAILSVPGYVQKMKGRESPEAVRLSAHDRPNIYHIVLDELGRSDVLGPRFGLSLVPFMAALRQRGFTVSHCASSNYVQTYFSLASMLNVDLFQNLLTLPAETQSRVPARHLIQANRVVASLRAVGYRTVWIGSGYAATDDYPSADVCICDRPWIGEYESVVLQATGLGRFLPTAPQAASWAAFVNGRLARIQSLPVERAPTFTLIHVLSPHDPLVFRSDGSLASQTEPLSFRGTSSFKGTLQEYRSAYAEQASYVVREALRGLDHILAIAPRDSIIIVHGDHGPRASQPIDPSEAFPIFLAIRWPDGILDETGPVSLVNVYRRILSRHLGADLPDLPNRHFISTDDRPYGWIEVSEPPCSE